MRLLQYLKEEYEASIRAGVSIYKNPSSSDYRKLRKETGYSDLFLRIILDVKNKNIYVWDGLNGVHVDAFKTLKLKIDDDPYDILFGCADLKPGSYKLSGSNEFLASSEYIFRYGIGKINYNNVFNSNKVIKNLNWVKKYFLTGSIITQEHINGARIIIS